MTALSDIISLWTSLKSLINLCPSLAYFIPFIILLNIWLGYVIYKVYDYETRKQQRDSKNPECREDP